MDEQCKRVCQSVQLQYYIYRFANVYIRPHTLPSHFAFVYRLLCLCARCDSFVRLIHGALHCCVCVYVCPLEGVSRMTRGCLCVPAAPIGRSHLISHLNSRRAWAEQRSTRGARALAPACLPASLYAPLAYRCLPACLARLPRTEARTGQVVAPGLAEVGGGRRKRPTAQAEAGQALRQIRLAGTWMSDCSGTTAISLGLTDKLVRIDRQTTAATSRPKIWEINLPANW